MLSSYLLRLPLAVTVSQTFLFFYDLDNFEEFWSVFCKMSLDWDLSDDFLIVGPGDVFGEGGCRGGSGSLLLPLSRVDTVNITYWCGGELDHCQALSAKLPFSLSFPCSVLWINVTMNNPHSRSGSYFPP